MTITILEGQLTFEFAIDTPNIDVDTRLEVFSPYSNTTLFDLEAVLVLSNSRYSQFIVEVPSNFWNNHYNGMYIYSVMSGATTYDTGSFKLITQPGGDMGTLNHISTNENRQAEVVYRPNY